MKATLECLECVMKQALRAARIASTDPVIQRRILDETAKRIPTMDIERSPAEVSLCVYQLAAALSGNSDPYREHRRLQNEEVLRLEPELRDMLDSSPDRLATALHLAAAGNVIDLGTQHRDHIDLHTAIEQAMREKFAVDHTDAFREALRRSKTILYFLDNAGEIVFDKLLIEELQRTASVTAVVKGAPIINDAIWEDAEQVGLTRICEVIDNGGAYVGSPLPLLSEEFRCRMDQTDMLIGKGQGNYETLDAYPREVFLILRAKCEVVARHMGVALGQIGLISTKVRREQATGKT
ncbi:MAG TPA: ARMT1-like domain-containing protein [Candidatus Hydrogenedentes bacterium]|nr:ARMT1-like domain-containing protein [Candidatus Hydrogenedentota bacterium]HOL76205.1 ARMT1-like domain-containing protein [Candidatus Hydrogenedentota bacterium]HPO86490.1 ARMT1-like domain-containing protein [Candidatus Hydrogenedentota bacterium]